MIPPGRLVIAIAKDGMCATVTARPGGPFDKAELLEALRAAGVVQGIDDAACDKALSLKPDGPPLIVAHGMEAVSGLDGAFTLTVPLGIQPGKVRADGSIDFRDRDLVRSVLAGELLGTIELPTPGQPGLRVDGTTASAVNGRPVRLTFGKGVYVSPDGKVKAARDGVVAYREGASLDVTDHHNHNGDVDLKSGNLRIAGTVTVQGSVGRAFSVTATGDIAVRDAVDGGSLHAGGSASIGGTVRGGEDAIVRAQGDVVARTAEHAAVHCFGKLRVGEAIGSILGARHVEVMRRVRGGSILAEEAILAQEAGAPDATPTVLSVGVPTLEALATVLASVDAVKAAREARLHPSLAPSAARSAAVRTSKAAMAAVKPRDSTRPVPHGGTMSKPPVSVPHSMKLTDVMGGGRPSKLGLKPGVEIRDAASVAAEKAALVQTAFIHVAGVLHAGVVIQIGATRYNVDQQMRGVRFSFDPESAEIVVKKTSR
jgi:hypothetical protein